MSDRRRALVRPVASTARPPSILMGSPVRLVHLVPDQFNKGPQSFHTILAAGTIRDIARARWHDRTGGGHSSWRMPQRGRNGEPIPAALRRAGERLADELLKQ